MDIVTRKQLNLLIQLAESDKHFSSMEREMIFEIARKNKFPSSEVRELIRNPEPLESFGALSDNQRFEYLYTCISLMLVDNKIFESELVFCKNIAIKLGFNKEVVEFLKNEINNHTKEDLKQIIFEKYY